MALDPAYIRTRFPGVFDVVTDAALNGAITAAFTQVNRTALGANADEAQLYLACHIAEITKAGRASGIHRGKAGLVEIDFGARGGSSSFKDLYDQLVKRVVFPATVTTGF